MTTLTAAERAMQRAQAVVSKEPKSSYYNRITEALEADAPARRSLLDQRQALEALEARVKSLEQQVERINDIATLALI